MLNNFKLHKSKGNLTHGKFLKEYFCINCNKKISKFAGIYGKGHCGSCAQKRKRLSNLTKFKIGIKSKKNWKNKAFIKKNQTKYIKHHIYGKSFNDILIISRKLHKTIHSQAYFYLLEKFGKKEVNNYIKWFENKFNIKLHEEKK
jgi:hypothetical protein